MKSTAAVLGAVAVLVAAADLSAQERPDFTGQWQVVADADAPARGGGGGRGGRGGGGRGGMGGLGQAATIEQTGATLTIVRTTQAGEVRTSYALDGSESRNTVTMGRAGGEVEQISTARWDGSTLVITSTMDMGGNPVETSLSLSLDEAGNLVVEQTGGGRRGGGGGGGGMTLRYSKGA